MAENQTGVVPEIEQIVIENPNIYGLGKDNLIYIYMPTAQEWTLLTKSIGRNS